MATPKSPFNTRVWNYLSSTLQEFADALSPYLSGPQANYKIYRALLTQSGSGDPTVIELENTLGNVAWTRVPAANGTYLATLSDGVFTFGQTFMMVASLPNNAGAYIGHDREDNVLYLNTTNAAGTNTDGLLGETSVEIFVYN